MLCIIFFGSFLILNCIVGVETTPSFSFLGRFGCIDKKTGCQRGAKGPSRFYGPAYALAVSDAQGNNVSKDVTDLNIDFDIINTIEASPDEWSDYMVAQSNAVDKTHIGMMGFDSSCAEIVRMMQGFNKLVISTHCDVSNDVVTKSNSLVQFAPTSRAKSLSVLALLKRMQWDDVYIAALGQHDEDNFMKTQYEDLVSLLRNNDVKTKSSFVLLDDAPYATKRMLRLVMDNYLKKRVFIVIDGSIYGDYAVRLIDTMARFGLLQTGEYFVITLLDDYKTDGWMTSLTNNPFFHSIIYDGDTRCVTSSLYMEQWRSMGLVSFLPPMEHESRGWETFVDRIWESYATPPCPPLCPLYTKGIDKSVGYNAITYWKTIAIIYDATAFMLKQLGKGVRAGVDVSNGSDVQNLFRNQKFKSVTGKDIYLNSYGAAQHQYQYILPLQLSNKGIMTNTLSVVADFIPNGDEAYAYVLRNNSVGFQYINGKPPTGKPRCGFHGELCEESNDHGRYYIILGVVFSLLTFAAIIAFIRQQQKFEKSLHESKWKIASSDIIIKGADVQESMNGSSIIGVADLLSEQMDRLKSAETQRLLQKYEANLIKEDDRPPSRQRKRSSLIKPAFKDRNDAEWSDITDWTVGKFKNHVIVLKRIHKTDLNMTRDLRLELHQMVAIGNEFVNKIYGFVYEPPRIFAVSTYCSRKSLKEILENGQLRLENMFIVSFIMDILKGLKYLHQSPLGFHGNLKSKTCLVDATWRVLLANFGMVHMREGETDNNDSDLMWTAPELLRRNNKKTDMSKISLQHADVYSFGIILHEILSRAGPWGGAPFSCSEILEQLKYPTDDDYYRPNLKLIKNPHPAALETCKACWEEEPELRPKVQKVKKMLQPLAKGMKGNIADNLMSLLDRYKNNLLDVVEEKIAQLNEERMRSERLLLQMLPAQVAHALKNGLTVEAEHYPSVTIYFSDIVGFTHMSSESTPMQVVHFLNDLYTVFDTILDDFDVYKVETIGDAYMMASGVPLANGINHAGEIASTALRLLESITDFKITHRPNDPLKLRMGIHSGSVVTGVVGVKMPRYCLFGSSVTFASQMESYGLPRKIHISSQTKELLDQLGGYSVEERGYTEIASREKQLTYWLNGADQRVRLDRLQTECLEFPSLKRASQGAIFE